MSCQGPVRPRRPKRLSTPPDSPYLKLQKPTVCDIEAGVTCDPNSANITLATIECTGDKSNELPQDQKPSRSCLPSVSDSIRKCKSRTVSFVEVSEDRDDNYSSIPPPLPPKSQLGIKSDDNFSSEGENTMESSYA